MSLGNSMLVPCVQELAKECTQKVPDRYIIDPDNEIVVNNNVEFQLPVINMEAIVNGDDKELQRMHSACQEWGFFQLINHGVSSSLIEKFKLESEEFFNMSMEEKKKYWQTPSDLEGFGQAFVKSEEQKLPWSDMFYMQVLPKHTRKPHLLPMLPLPFRDTVEQYSTEVQSLAVRILDCMAAALKVDVEVMRAAFGEEKQSMRMNYCPPCPEPDKVVGLMAHQDITALTILLQVSDTDGLQIDKDGKWVPVSPLQGAFIVNIGNILVMLSNDIYQSISHRVVVNSSKKRLSVATQHTPSLDKEIGPIPSLVAPNTPARFRRVNMKTYMKEMFATTRGERSFIDFFRI